jgi:hypothetical protein
MRNEQIPIAQFPTINREDAQRFLLALDDQTEQFTFQVFDDHENRNDKTLARILHGTLTQHYATLVDYSRRGAGIFVVVNETNLLGRTKECIITVRSYFADLDGPPLQNIIRLNLRPHIMTQTSVGRYGVFYNIADAPLDEKNFKRTQLTLAELFESDASVCDLPRVMRLPGFLHQKNPQKPFVTEIDFNTSQKTIEGKTPIYTEAEFQKALSSALVWYRPRKSIAIASMAGLPKAPPDWSEGYKEGERNNECARRAGSCLARGMSEEQTLAECLRWNARNQPPLDQKEVRECVHSIAKREAKKPEGGALSSDTQRPLQDCGFIFDGEASGDPPKMLIKKLLPSSGIAFIGGQSGAGKTFVAIAVAVALASGTEFFKYRVKEPIGVAYVAAEGIGMFAQRVAAAKLAIDVKKPIPFAWSGSVPTLQTDEGFTAFVAELRSLKQEMQQRFNVRLGAVFMDTVAACFVMQDENSNAEVSKVCNIMRHIGDSIGAVIIPIHHYGKDAATGLRGASAWRGAADVTISVTAVIDQLTGKVSNRALALAKARDAEQGPVAPFILEWVKLGVDDDGEDFGTCIVELDPTRGLQGAVRDTRPKSIRAWDDACRIAFGEHGQDVQLRKDEPLIRAVELRHVKAKFCEIYVTGEGDPKKAAGAKDRAYRRVLDKMPADYVVEIGQDGREWLWLKVPSPR